MGDREQDDESDVLSAGDAFSKLGNETRFEVLRTLAEADGPLSFTDLRDRVGVPAGGQFNYHLDKLVGHFVRKVDDGYELGIAGEEVVRAVQAGVITEDPTLEPTQVDAGCPTCGEPVEIRYRDELLLVRCTVCEGSAGGDYPRGTYVAYPFPAAGLEGRTPREILRAARTFYDGKAEPMVDGVCPECAGQVEKSLDLCADHDRSEGSLCDACDARYRCWADFECTNCGYHRRSAVWYRVLARPEVVAAYPEADALGDTLPFNRLAWEDPPYIDAVTEDIVCRDPLRLRARIRVGDHELEVTVDEDLQLLDVSK